ncbi:MAG: hypothetical protein JNK82_22785 [Myxococcaceae bacterium]|nr:hypothetical protein [Myxococcaceae bacterium]
MKTAIKILKPLMIGVLATTSLAACNDNQPCTTNCPAIEGTWFLQYVAPVFPCDGGSAGEPPPTVAFFREGSVVRGAIAGVEVRGTVYDTFDFTLNGTSPDGALNVSLRGRYKPSTGSDSGDESIYDGTLIRSTSACRDDRRFTGARYR